MKRGTVIRRLSDGMFFTICGDGLAVHVKHVDAGVPLLRRLIDGHVTVTRGVAVLVVNVNDEKEWEVIR